MENDHDCDEEVARA